MNGSILYEFRHILKYLQCNANSNKSAFLLERYFVEVVNGETLTSGTHLKKIVRCSYMDIAYSKIITSSFCCCVLCVS